jgi:protein gp37
MSIHTKIEWCDSTINPTSGCEGCELWSPELERQGKATCFAAALHKNRLAKSLPTKYGRDFREYKQIYGRMRQAAHWHSLSGKIHPNKPWFDNRPRHIFVGDLSDIFLAHEEFIQQEILFHIRSEYGSRHTWIFCTKRPARMAQLSKRQPFYPPNLICLTTVTDQATANERIPHLLDTHCARLGLSIEPILGDIVLRPDWLARLNWVICGPERGPHARPHRPDWIESIKHQCRTYDVPFFDKRGPDEVSHISRQLPLLCP